MNVEVKKGNVHMNARCLAAILAIASVASTCAYGQSGVISDPANRSHLGYAWNATSKVFDLTFLGDGIQSGLGGSAPAFVLNPTDIWAITFLQGTTETVVGPSQLDPAAGTLSVVNAGSSMTATWAGVRKVGGTSTFDVVVDISIPTGQKAVEFYIDIDASNYGSALKSIAYPRIDARARSQTPADERLTIPLEEGLIVSDLTDSLGTTSLSPFPGMSELYPGRLSMQWMSYYSVDDSTTPATPAVFMYGTRDTHGYIKRIGAKNGSGAGGVNSALFSITHYPENNLTTTQYDSSGTYPCVISGLRGDWYSAARFYRSWVTNSSAPWVASGPMHANSDFSSIIKEASLFSSMHLVPNCDKTISTPGYATTPSPCTGEVCPIGCRCDVNRPDFQYWTPRLQDLYNEFGVGLIPVHLYNWDDLHWAGDKGDWGPIDPFYAAAAGTAGQAWGHPFAPYFLIDEYSQRVADYGNGASLVQYPGLNLDVVAVRQGDAPSYTIEELGAHVVCNPLTGKTPNCECNPTTILCDATPFARDYASYWVGELVKSGASGVYLDANSLKWFLCYNRDTHSTTSHDHGPAGVGGAGPVGGGKYYTENKRALSSRLRAEMRANTAGGGAPVAPQAYQMTESNCETMIDLIELAYSRAFGAGEPIPRNPSLPRAYHAPLFQTVYHDYSRTTTITHIGFPSGFDNDGGGNPMNPQPWDIGPGAAKFNSDPAQLVARYLVGTAVFSGTDPWYSLFISSESFATTKSNFPAIAKTTGFVKSLVDVIECGAIRDYAVLGPRLRDPETNSPTTHMGLLTPWFDEMPYRPYGDTQPYVRAAAFGHKTIQGRVGVYLINWTGASDGTYFPMSIPVPGTKSVTVTIRAADYGLPNAVVSLKEYTGCSTIATTIDLTSGVGMFTTTVPERSGKFVVVGS